MRRCSMLPVLCVCVAFVLVSSVACNNSDEAVSAAARKFIESSDKAQPVPPIGAVANERPRIYLDATVSMAGYMRKAGSTDRTTFDEFLDALADFDRPELFRFGQPFHVNSRPTIDDVVWPTTFSGAIHSDRFYNLEYNPDDVLIDSIAKEKQRRISILVTDGVHSDPIGQHSPPVVEAIGRWLDGGGVLGIIAANSRYIGPLYSERLRRMIEVPTVDRPFYAFVFSPTSIDWRALREHLRARFANGLTIFAFTDGSVSGSVSPDRSEHMMARLDPPDVHFLFRMFAKGITNPQSDARYGVRLQLQLAADYPIQRVSVDVHPVQFRWSGQGFLANPEPSPDGFEAALQPCPGDKERDKERDTCHRLVTRFSRDGKSKYVLYRLALVMRNAGMRAEIDRNSTRDDTVPESAAKTFLFADLMKAVADAHMTSRLARTLPHIYYAVQQP